MTEAEEDAIIEQVLDHPLVPCFHDGIVTDPRYSALRAGWYLGAGHSVLFYNEPCFRRQQDAVRAIQALAEKGYKTVRSYEEDLDSEEALKIIGEAMAW